MEKKSRTFLVDLEKDDWSSTTFSVISFGGIETCWLQILLIIETQLHTRVSPKICKGSSHTCACLFPSFFRIRHKTQSLFIHAAIMVKSWSFYQNKDRFLPARCTQEHSYLSASLSQESSLALVDPALFWRSPRLDSGERVEKTLGLDCRVGSLRGGSDS